MIGSTSARPHPGRFVSTTTKFEPNSSHKPSEFPPPPVRWYRVSLTFRVSITTFFGSSCPRAAIPASDVEVTATRTATRLRRLIRVSVAVRILLPLGPGDTNSRIPFELQRLDTPRADRYIKLAFAAARVPCSSSPGGENAEDSLSVRSGRAGSGARPRAVDVDGNHQRLLEGDCRRKLLLQGQRHRRGRCSRSQAVRAGLREEG